LILQDQWYRRAQLALDKGEEELARDALRRKKSFSDNAAMLKKQLDQHTRASGQLMTNIRSVKVNSHGVTHASRLYCCIWLLLQVDCRTSTVHV
jgi:phage shock protein A